MNLYVYYIVIVTSLMCTTFSQDTSDSEVCDVEGSGSEDCPSADHCCMQSKCDLIYNPDNNPDKKCCTKAQRDANPLRSDCLKCTECCDDAERTQTPVPSHCSKCRRCEEGNYHISYI